jgi:hypothetical protein
LLAGLAASSAAAANTGTWSGGLKWLGISAVLLGAGGALWRSTETAPTRVEVPAQIGHAPTRAMPRAAADKPDGASPVVTGSAAPLNAAPPARAASPSAAPSRTASTGRGAADARLAEELLAVSRARAAVSAGAPDGALATLDAVPGGFVVLPLEASLVRVEALRGAGKLAAARALAEQLLRAHPDGPYTERLRSLTAVLGSSTGAVAAPPEGEPPRSENRR